MLLSLGLILLGIALLVGGGEALLRGAVGMASRLRLTPAVIGLTVVAAGTSVPELAVSGAAALRGTPDIAVANVIGSNIFNIAAIVGLAALVRPFKVEGNTLRLEYPVLVLVTLMGVALVADGQVSRLDALLLLATYVGFTAYLVALVRGQATPAEVLHFSEEVDAIAPADPGLSLGRSLLYVAGGVALLGAGAEATVRGAVDLARLWGWSERVIGLTIVSVGTSLPEVVASVVSSLRGRSDVALGNVIGSNLFNLLVILGVTGAILPIPVAPALATVDAYWMMGLTLLLAPLLISGSRLTRLEGGLLVAAFAGYLALLVRGG